MAIANVTLSDTFFQWMTKTNQINYQSEETSQLAILSFGTSNAATNIAVTSFGRTNLAYAQANTGVTNAGLAWTQANTARDHANTAYGQANTARIHANAAYQTANVVVFAYNQANAAFAAANTTGGPTIAAYNQANTARDHANTSYGQANTARDHANTSYAQANGAYNQATLARGHANVAFAQGNSAFTQANTATTNAANAHGQANTAITNASNAHIQANAAFAHANTVWAAANNVTKGKHTIWVPAVSMIARSTNGPEAGTIETNTNKVMHKTLNFDPSAIELAQFGVMMPKSWNEGGISAKFVWSHASTTVNFGTVWGIQAMALADGDPIDGLAFGTAVTVTDTGGTANSLYHTAETAELTVAGAPADGEYITFQVYRAATDGADNLAVDARLVGVRLLYTTNAQTDD